jgi:hypothetical protein
MEYKLIFDRNKIVGIEDVYYGVWMDYLEANLPFIMQMDISGYNPRLDACKNWLYEHGKGHWATEAVTMNSMNIRCSDKNDMLMCKLKFGGT